MELTLELLSPFADTTFSNSSDVSEYFHRKVNQSYIRWFNKTLADKGSWAGITLLDTPHNDVQFAQFCDQIRLMFGGDATMIEFVCLMAIVANEARGNFNPAVEQMGIAGHAGMAYLFDAIAGSKRSYNTLAGNKTAFDCFNDSRYIAAHSSEAFASELSNTTDARWAGTVWPSEFATNPLTSGFIGNADFMKFRGRGFIQTTGRANYLPLISFVQAYEASNATISIYQKRWTGNTPDAIASASSNTDWDTLFQQTQLIIASEAIRNHNNRSGNYLNLSRDPQVLNGTSEGSVYNMGLRISGGKTYAALYKDRVAAVLTALAS